MDEGLSRWNWRAGPPARKRLASRYVKTACKMPTRPRMRKARRAFSSCRAASRFIAVLLRGEDRKYDLPPHCSRSPVASASSRAGLARDSERTRRAHAGGRGETTWFQPIRSHEKERHHKGKLECNAPRTRGSFPPPSTVRSPSSPG